MIKYLNFLCRSILNFIKETLAFIKSYLIWIIVIVAVLYFADVGKTQSIIDGWISTVKSWF